MRGRAGGLEGLVELVDVRGLLLSSRDVVVGGGRAIGVGWRRTLIAMRCQEASIP